jgi:polysaccharide export outer membrane protein
LASYADPTKPAPVNFAAPPPLDEQVRSGPPTAANAPAQMTRINLAEAQAAPSDQHKLNDRDVVMVLADETRVIHVTGLVRKPNQFVLARDKDIHVLDAVAMAGGVISPLANKVYVIRQLPGMPEPAIIQVSLSAAKRDGNENIRLAAGDLVSVEATAATMALDTVTRFFRVAIGLRGSVPVF